MLTFDLEVYILKQPVACVVLNELQWELLVCHLEDGNFEDILVKYSYWHTQVIPLFYHLHQICKVFSSPPEGIDFQGMKNLVLPGLKQMCQYCVLLRERYFNQQLPLTLDWQETLLPGLQIQYIKSNRFFADLLLPRSCRCSPFEFKSDFFILSLLINPTFSCLQ